MSIAQAVGTDPIRDVRLARTPSPAAIVIFGATGDLTQRKLVPALYSLAVQQLLPPETTVVGVARSDLTDEEFRARMRTAVETHGRYDTGGLLLGLEILPRKKIEYRDKELEEFDLDAALAR